MTEGQRHKDWRKWTHEEQHPFYMRNMWLEYKDTYPEKEASINAFKSLIEFTDGFEEVAYPYNQDNFPVSQEQFHASEDAMNALHARDYVEAFRSIVRFMYNKGMGYSHYLSFNEYAVLNLIFNVFKKKLAEEGYRG